MSDREQIEPWDWTSESPEGFARRAIAAGTFPVFVPVFVRGEPAVASAGVYWIEPEVQDLARRAAPARVGLEACRRLRGWAREAGAEVEGR